MNYFLYRVFREGVHIYEGPMPPLSANYKEGDYTQQTSSSTGAINWYRHGDGSEGVRWVSIQSGKLPKELMLWHLITS